MKTKTITVAAMLSLSTSIAMASGRLCGYVSFDSKISGSSNDEVLDQSHNLSLFMHEQEEKEDFESK